MSEKKVTRESDFNSHIMADWKIVHRIWENVKAMFVDFYNTLWRDNTNDDVDDVYFQSGLDTAPVGSSATITFDVPYTVRPRVTATPETTNQDCNVVVNTITTTTFKMRLFNRTSGSGVSCDWIAIGRKDR